MVSRMEKKTITKLPEIGDKTYKKTTGVESNLYQQLGFFFISCLGQRETPS